LVSLPTIVLAKVSMICQMACSGNVTINKG
jgi:hypothetical protein